MGKLTSLEVGFSQGKIEDCVLYWGKSIYILYTDNYILSVPDEEELSHILAGIKVSGLYIAEEVDIEDFLGVKIDKVDSEIYHMSQPQRIR